MHKKPGRLLLTVITVRGWVEGRGDFKLCILLLVSGLFSAEHALLKLRLSIAPIHYKVRPE